MPKSSTALALFVGLVLLLAAVSQAARPEPLSPEEIQRQLGRAAVQDPPQSDVGGGGCEGVGEEECLMRRTLNAHLDYIYTQEKRH